MPTPGAERFIGMDIGRSKDLSVLMVGERTGDQVRIIRQEIFKRMPFHEQLKHLCDMGREAQVQRIAIDATGIGAMLAEEARRALGGKVMPVTFTHQKKNDLYSAMRRRFEERTVVIPSDRELREDLHGVQRQVSTSGTISYRAARNEDGHSDRASALALLIHAAERKGGFFMPITLKRRAR